MQHLLFYSTLPGALNNIFWCLIWLGVYAFAFTWAQKKHATYERNTFSDVPFLLRIVQVVIVLVALIHVCVIPNALAKSFTRTEILVENNQVTRVFWRKYGFLGQKETGTLPVDRITRIEASQGPIDRAVGTGSVKVTFQSFVSADTVSMTLTIPNIKNPIQAADEIRQRAPAHHGLRIEK